MSIVLNSTLQPILESFEGGGLNLMEFQLVDCRFSKWDIVSSSLMLSSSSLLYVGIGSRVKREAIWNANLSSNPLSLSIYICSGLTLYYTVSKCFYLTYP